MKRKKIVNIILLFLLVISFQGCTYMNNRLNDAQDMIDIGITFSKKPGFAVFYDFVPVIPVGFGYVDGYYVGIGGGKLNWFDPHFQKSYGLGLWGQEEVTFAKSLEEAKKLDEKERNKVMDFQRTGLIGMVQGPFPGPNYLISCPHYIHLGWIGLVGTPRYLQMLDFVLGWTTLDICFDDDKPEKKKEK